MVSLNVTLVLGWPEPGFGSVSQLQWAAHTPKAGNSSQHSCEGMNVPSRPRKERSRGASGNSFTNADRIETIVASGQSAAAAPAGCCFIISSIPFFISLAVGSALCVPTIHV
jgi:hypothetical protein